MAKRTTSEKVTGHVSKKPVTSLADLESEDESGTSDGGAGEESAGESAGEATEETPVLRKKQRPTKRQLATQDIQAARETAELFKSNIFKLQIDELLKEVKLKDAHVSLMEQALHRLYDLIQQVPETRGLTLGEAGASLSPNVAIPFPDPKPAGSPNYRFGYAAPQDVLLVGSFGLKTAIRTPEASTISVALTMPASLFEAKDYLNYRAVYKRAFYAAHLAAHLARLACANHFPIKVSYTNPNDDPLDTALLVESVSTAVAEDLVFARTRLSIRILVGFPAIFEARKLAADRNCVRIQTEGELPATPLYNCSLVASTHHAHYLKFLYKNRKQTDQFKDAAMLAQIWLRQRGFTSLMLGLGFGEFEFLMVMAVLSQGGEGGKPVLMRGFSSYQLFKGTIRYLLTMDLSSRIVFTSEAVGNIMAGTATVERGINATPVLLDTHTGLDLFWKMTPVGWTTLQAAATATLSMLNEVVADRFAAVFLERVAVSHLRHDVLMALPVATIDSALSAVARITDLTWERHIVSSVSLVLQAALGARAVGICVWMDRTPTAFSLTKRRAAALARNLFIGLNLCPAEADKAVTRGPAADDEAEARAFRQFWGDRVTLRRFKDGSIEHCVVWPTGAPVVETIVKFALDKHQAELSTHLTCDWGVWNALLPVSVLPGAALQPFHQCRSAMDRLVGVLTALTLPLRVRSVVPGRGGNARYTSLIAPVPFAVASPDFFQELVLLFETSTRWPDELIALERTKTALLLAAMDAINEESTYQCYIQRDSTVPGTEAHALCVLTPDGYGFRVRVLTERDELLYLRAVANAGRQKPRLQECFLKFSETYVASVRHARTLTTLATNFPAYSSVVRLVKRWMDTHLLMGHFSDTFIELVSMAPFVDPAPFSPPATVQNGFLRVLSFLAKWNWREDPLVLDLVREGVEDDVAQIRLSDRLTVASSAIIAANFARIRQADPHGIKTQFFIGSKDDPSGILWTQNVTVPIASRLTALARAAVGVVGDGSPLPAATVNALFTPAYGDYDFVLRLQTADLAVASGVCPPGSFKNLISAPSAFPEELALALDPIQEYVRELNHKFSNVVLFSVHRYTGLHGGHNVVTGLFNPAVVSKTKFKVNIGYNIRPVGKGEVVLNKKSLMNEIVRLGGDLVIGVEMKGKAT